jgi:hypothetical protein
VKIKRCKGCGFSLALSRVVRFKNNGTIVGRMDENFRLALIEADFFTEIFQRIEEELGLPIQHLVFEAQRNSSTEVIDVFLKGLAGTVRWTPLGKRTVVNMFCHLAIWTGQGYAKATTYKSGKLGEAIVRNPFNRELFAAVIVGAFESLDRKPYGFEWKKLDGEDLISIHPEPARPEIAERMTFTKAPMKPGWREYERCPRCKVPRALDFEWREDEGTVIDRRHNVRMVFLDHYTPGVVFRELARELGEEVYPIIVEAQREFSLRHLRQEFPVSESIKGEAEREGFYGSVLETLALRGQGNPVESLFKEGTLRVIIENPFDPHLLAGHLSAVYELGEGRPAAVAWEQMDPSSLEFILTPA